MGLLSPSAGEAAAAASDQAADASSSLFPGDDGGAAAAVDTRVDSSHSLFPRRPTSPSFRRAPADFPAAFFPDADSSGSGAHLSSYASLACTASAAETASPSTAAASSTLPAPRSGLPRAACSMLGEGPAAGLTSSSSHEWEKAAKLPGATTAPASQQPRGTTSRCSSPSSLASTLSRRPSLASQSSPGDAYRGDGDLFFSTSHSSLSSAYSSQASSTAYVEPDDQHRQERPRQQRQEEHQQPVQVYAGRAAVTSVATRAPAVPPPIPVTTAARTAASELPSAGRHRRSKALLPVTSWLTKQQWARELRRQWLSSSGWHSRFVTASAGRSDLAGAGDRSTHAAAVADPPVDESEEAQEARSSFYCNAELCRQAVAHIRLRAARLAQRIQTNEAAAAAAAESTLASQRRVVGRPKPSAADEPARSASARRQSSSAVSAAAASGAVLRVSAVAACSIAPPAAAASSAGAAASSAGAATASVSSSTPSRATDPPATWETSPEENGSPTTSGRAAVSRRCCFDRRSWEHLLGGHAWRSGVPSGSASPEEAAAPVEKGCAAAPAASASVRGAPTTHTGAADSPTGGHSACTGVATAVALSLPSSPPAFNSRSKPHISISAAPGLPCRGAGVPAVVSAPSTDRSSSETDEQGRLVSTTLDLICSHGAVADAAAAAARASADLCSALCLPSHGGTNNAAAHVTTASAEASPTVIRRSPAVEAEAVRVLALTASAAAGGESLEEHAEDTALSSAAAVSCAESITDLSVPAFTGRRGAAPAASEERLPAAAAAEAGAPAASFSSLRLDVASHLERGGACPTQSTVENIVENAGVVPLSSCMSSSVAHPTSAGATLATSSASLASSSSSAETSPRLRQASSANCPPSLSSPSPAPPLLVRSSVTSSDHFASLGPPQQEQQQVSLCVAAAAREKVVPSSGFAGGGASPACSPQFSQNRRGALHAGAAAVGVAADAVFSACAVHGIECNSRQRTSAKQLREFATLSSLEFSPLTPSESSFADVSSCCSSFFRAGEDAGLSPDACLRLPSSSVPTAAVASINSSIFRAQQLVESKQPFSEIQLSPSYRKRQPRGLLLQHGQQQQPHRQQVEQEQDDKQEQRQHPQELEGQQDTKQRCFRVQEGLQLNRPRGFGESEQEEEEEESEQQQAQVQEKQHHVAYAGEENELRGGVEGQQEEGGGEENSAAAPQDQQHRRKRAGESLSLQQQRPVEDGGGEGAPGGGAVQHALERNWSAAGSLAVSERRLLQPVSYYLTRSEVIHRRALHAFVSSFAQQTQTRSSLPFRLFLRSWTSVCCSCWGLLLLVVGIGVMLLSRQSVEIVIPYESRTLAKVFRTKKDMHPPVYVYYRIEDFYGNFRPYVRDGPRTVSSAYKCETVRSQVQALNFRTFNGTLTLHWLLRDALTGAPIPPSNSPVCPCGLQSVAIYNDVFRLYTMRPPVPEHPHPAPDAQEIFVATSEVAYGWDFVQYMKPVSSWEKEGAQPWILTGDPRFRLWMHPPFTPDFQKLYGIIHEPLHANHWYTINFTDASWPAEEWKAKKSIVFLSLGPLVGNPNDALAYSCICAGCLCLLGVLLLWLLHVLDFFSLSWTVRHADLEKVCEEAQSGGEETEEAGIRGADAGEGLSLLASTKAGRLDSVQQVSLQQQHATTTAGRLETSPGAGVGSAAVGVSEGQIQQEGQQELYAEEDDSMLVGDDKAVAAWVAEHFKHPIACLCPYHCPTPDPFTYGTSDVDADVATAASALPTRTLAAADLRQQAESEQQQQQNLYEHKVVAEEAAEQHEGTGMQHKAVDSVVQLQVNADTSVAPAAAHPQAAPKEAEVGRLGATEGEVGAEGEAYDEEEEGGSVLVGESTREKDEPQPHVFPATETGIGESEAELYFPADKESEEDLISPSEEEQHNYGEAAADEAAHGWYAGAATGQAASGPVAEEPQWRRPEKVERPTEPQGGGEQLPVLSRLRGSKNLTAVRWESSVTGGGRELVPGRGVTPSSSRVSLSRSGSSSSSGDGGRRGSKSSLSSIDS